MKVTIGKKLYSSFLIIILLIGLLGLFVIAIMNDLNKAFNEIFENEIPSIIMTTEINALILENYGILLEHIIAPDSKSKHEIELEYKERQEKIDEALHSIAMTLHSEEEKAALSNLFDYFESYKEGAYEIFVLSKFNLRDESLTLLWESKNVVTQVQKEAKDLVTINVQAAKDTNEVANRLFENNRKFIIIAIFITLILGMGFAFVITRKISKPVIAVSKTVNSVANGDLTIDPLEKSTKDEVGILVTSVNKMVKDLRKVISETNEASHHVATASEQLSASAEQSALATEQLSELAQSNAEGAEFQIKKIEEVSQLIGQMVDEITRISDDSINMGTLTDQAIISVRKGNNSVDNVVTRINDIQLSFEKITKAINALNNRSSDIGHILKIITDISNQTNLLALNAAIEAARAGVAGKGFAVVADEVRNLADQSKKSADQIAELLKDIQNETNQAVLLINEGNSKVLSGISSSNEVTKSFSEIERSMGNVSVKVGNVSTSIEEINEISKKIVHDLEHVETITEKNAISNYESTAATEELLATIEEISSSSQQLSNLAGELQETICNFRVK